MNDKLIIRALLLLVKKLEEEMSDLQESLDRSRKEGDYDYEIMTALSDFIIARDGIEAIKDITINIREDYKEKFYKLIEENY